MAQQRPPDPILIADDEALTDFVNGLQGKTCVAMDTEAASFHRYVDRIYLIQISSDSATAIVDPLAVTNLKRIGDLLADPSIEVVFHDADYDLRVLDRDYGFHARNLFDTRITAQLLGEPGIGLGPLLQKYFDVRADKRFQRADWSKRPLTPEMISYAATDTAYLLSLRNKLHKQLVSTGRLAWAQEEFKRLESIRWTSPTSNQGYLRLKGAKSLAPKSLAVLRAAYEWREEQAANLDRAPFRVLGNDALSALARSTPTTHEQLGAVNGVPTAAVRRYGTQLLKAVRAGLRTPAREYPRVERTQRPKINRTTYERLQRLKAVRTSRAEQLGIEMGVLCPNGTLQAIAQAVPTTAKELREIDHLKKWQEEALGVSKLLDAVHGNNR